MLEEDIELAYQLYQDTRKKYELEFNQSLSEIEQEDDLDERFFSRIIKESGR